MANAFTLSPRKSDSATITSSSAVGGCEAANVQRARPKLFWRTTAADGWLKGDFGTATAVDTIVLGYINMVEGSTISLAMSATEAGLLSPSFSQTFTSHAVSDFALSHHPLILSSEQTYRWWKLSFDFTGLASYVQIGRLMVGKRIEPATSVEMGWSAGGDEPVAETVDMGGEESPRPMGVKRWLEVNWHNLLQSEHDLLYKALLARGSSGDIALVVNSDVVLTSGAIEQSQIAIGRVKQSISLRHTLLSLRDGVNEQHYALSARVAELAPVSMT